MNKCNYCATIENLYIDKIGRKYNICLSCRAIMYKNNEQKRKITLSTLGVTNISQLQAVKDKKVQVHKDNTGYEYPSQNPETKQKTINTNSARRGVANISQDPLIKEQKRNKSIKAYGTSCTLQASTVKQKTLETMQIVYNVDHPSHSDTINNKRYETNIQRYNHKTPAQSDEVKATTVLTNRERYNVDYVTQVNDFKQKAYKTKKSNNWDIYTLRLAKKGITPLFSKEYFVHNHENFKFICNYCNKEFSFDATNPQHIRCTCTHNRSQYEKEIAEWLTSIGIPSLELNKRYMEQSVYKYEIDIFLPGHNLGIDFHGLYWHSDLYKDRQYHQQKYLYFTDKQIDYIQIFENEWINNKDIVKSIILTKLGMIDNKLFARNCIIKPVAHYDTNSFLEKNHLQGSCVYTFSKGLFYEDELVAIMTVGHHRQKENSGYELLRFSTKLNTRVIGGFSKLLSAFMLELKSDVYSFVDIRYFKGDSYIKSGFILEYITKPNYFYFKQNTLELESRLQYQKHKLKDKLALFDAVLSEHDNMINNSYFCIYDAGHLKFTKKFTGATICRTK